MGNESGKFKKGRQRLRRTEVASNSLSDDSFDYNVKINLFKSYLIAF